MSDVLPENERMALAEIEALMLRAMQREPMTHRQIARVLNTSHGNVQNIQARALGKLRRLANRGIE